MLSSLDADLKAKQDKKYSVEREEEAKKWIEVLTGETIENFQESLKDGIILCKLATVLTGKTIKYSESKLGFKQMENINSFLTAIADMGIRPFETFMTVDLFEAKNMGQVVDCIFAVSRTAAKNGFDGPRLGPKMATANERTFTEEQLAASKGIIPKLTGFNKGASQSGMTFGAKRQIGGKYASFGDAEVELDTSSSKGYAFLLAKNTGLDGKVEDENDSVLDLIDEHLKTVSIAEEEETK